MALSSNYKILINFIVTHFSLKYLILEHYDHMSLFTTLFSKATFWFSKMDILKNVQISKKNFKFR
jgi:hypothetical protein